MIKELLIRNRSYRRFDESIRISREQLSRWVDLTRFVASARNQQALKYHMVIEPRECDQLFPMLAWAGYLSDWPGPIEGERPVAYVVVLNDGSLTHNLFCDDGLAIQSLLLGAVEEGFGGCIIGSLRKEGIRQLFHYPETLDILYVIALGKPIEQVSMVPMKEGNIRYWRDEKQVHYVPKRSLEEILFRP